MRVSTLVWSPTLQERTRETFTSQSKVSWVTSDHHSWFRFWSNRSVRHFKVKRSFRFSIKCSNSCVLFLVPPIFQRVTNRLAAWGQAHEGDNEDMVERREVVLGHSVSLSCESNAIPRPKLSWYKDGRKLTSADGVALLPGQEELFQAWPKLAVLLLYIIFTNHALFCQKDRCCRSPVCSRRMLGGTHARLWMKQGRTTCILSWRSSVSNMWFDHFWTIQQW